MHIHKSKKIIVFISIILLILFSIIFMDSDEEQYKARVQATINQIKNYSLEIDNIDLNENPEQLVLTYEKIVETAKAGTKLQPPSTMVKFDDKLNNYLNDTIVGYNLLIEGTNNNDLEMIRKGINTLSKLDDSFLKELTVSS